MMDLKFNKRRDGLPRPFCSAPAVAALLCAGISPGVSAGFTPGNGRR
jgi:hypothetical protein